MKQSNKQRLKRQKEYFTVAVCMCVVLNVQFSCKHKLYFKHHCPSIPLSLTYYHTVMSSKNTHFERMFLRSKKSFIITPSFNKSKAACFTSCMCQGINNILKVLTSIQHKFLKFKRCMYLA